MVAAGPGWRREVRTRSAAGRVTKRSGGVRSAASPSTPAWTDRYRGAHLEARCTPSLHGVAGALAEPLEDEDSERAIGEGASESLHERVAKRVCVVRHEHHGRRAVLAPMVVHQAQGPRLAARAEVLRRGLQERQELQVAVRGLADRVPVDPE